MSKVILIWNGLFSYFKLYINRKTDEVIFIRFGV